MTSNYLLIVKKKFLEKIKHFYNFFFLAVSQNEMVIDTIYDSSKPIEKINNEDSYMDHDGNENKSKTVVTGRITKKLTKPINKKLSILPNSLKIDGNVQINHTINNALKKHKKKSKKLSIFLLK